MQTSVVMPPQKTLLGHPRGLFVLFFTEMWERFNYYGMRALLILYMVNYFKWPQEQSSRVYKWFTALVYLTPLIGGFLADKYLGNKWAIILGASTMAIGQFCMTVDSEQVFYVALGLLICGNGLFKPNMATQVGRLYPPNDPRRDSAYTIFYMGVNLGAFIAPLVCSVLRESTAWGFKAGFAAAGVGMIIGLLTYLLGLPVVRRDMEFAASSDASTRPAGRSAAGHYISEAEAATTPSASPALSRAAPTLMALLLVAILVVPWLLVRQGILKNDDIVAYTGCGGVACIMGWMILGKISKAVRDRVMVIYILGLFVIFFWGAFEQAGNAMSIYADKTTNRYLSDEPPPPSIYPEVQAESSPSEQSGVAPSNGKAPTGWRKLWNPVKTEWFQSINALAIFVLGPVFAWLWVFLPGIGLRVSTPAKMAIGVFIQGMAFALMTWSIRYEAQPSSADLAALPAGVVADKDGRVIFRDAPDLSDDKGAEGFAAAKVDEKEPKVVQGGRILFDGNAKRLNMTGVLPDTDRDRLFRASVSPEYLKNARELALASAAAEKEKGKDFVVQVKLDTVPPGFDLRYVGLPEKAVRFDMTSKTLSATVKLADRDYKGLLVAGADPAFRDALNKLFVESAKFKVSPSWLLWFYVLCTLGELCLSPVGLSMVSKLAPAAYGTMMMGMWHLTSFFGNYTAGQLGEVYGSIDPGTYFTRIGGSLMVVSFVCFLVVRKVKSMMHGVQ
ncbi:MAG: peptide MFS transporter [Planctomycetota bacterium]